MDQVTTNRSVRVSGCARGTMGGVNGTSLFSGKGTCNKDCICHLYILHCLCNIESKVRETG